MKIVNLSELVKSVLIVGLAAIFVGCAEQKGGVSVSAIDQSLPQEMRDLQGLWILSTINEQSMCEAHIQGYTIRVRYRKKNDESQVKQNISIKSIDAQHDQLLTYGKDKPVQYQLKYDSEGHASLLLTFFEKDSQRWETFQLAKNMR